jgi:hypothetical protein
MQNYAPRRNIRNPAMNRARSNRIAAIEMEADHCFLQLPEFACTFW